MTTLEDHKHCIYCGLSTLTDKPCAAANNPLVPDTAGNKSHVYIGTCFPPDRVTFWKPKH